MKERRLIVSYLDEKKKDTKLKISQSAIKMFEKKGVDKTTIRDIMSNTDLGLGTFYSYFKDKDDLKEQIVLSKVTDLVVETEKKCDQEDHVERFISFLNYIIDYYIANPFEFELVASNLNWALYARVENDKRFAETDTTLKYILNKYSQLFSKEYSDSQKLYILSLTIETVISTCKLAIRNDSILSIDEMKSVLVEVIKQILNR
ncbi:transcriptional regulator, TetR family [Finegoldia magna ATCC 53516]|uniref:Transcriptional regulator, TetR family n=1 Tax=Finegoldia magna ATCC 53516 TaxID=525282 RepID=D6S942_FINMA|nr:transcriptional regulator, TetR family [Finegoldia magna ATCC 53516]